MVNSLFKSILVDNYIKETLHGKVSNLHIFMNLMFLNIFHSTLTGSTDFYGI